MKSRRCAKAGLVLGRAGRHANLDESWDLKPWRTDIIRFPSAAEKALAEAMDADLMVLAGLRVWSTFTPNKNRRIIESPTEKVTQRPQTKKNLNLVPSSPY